MQIISCSKWRDTQNVESYSSLEVQLMDPSSETIKWFKNNLKNAKLKYVFTKLLQKERSSATLQPLQSRKNEDSDLNFMEKDEFSGLKQQELLFPLPLTLPLCCNFQYLLCTPRCLS